MSSLPVRLPPPVGPGDRIGVAALSGPVDPQRLANGLENLRRLGFEPVLADNLTSRRGFLAGTDAERLDAFHRLAADPDLPAILFTRGGHGLLRLLPGIDWDLLARHPRTYVGYSDLTPFLLGVVRRLGLVAFHGPLVAGELARGLSPVEEASFLDALAGRYPAEQPFASWVRPPRRLNGQSRAASGPLLGGCLSLLAATAGTPYFPDLDGSLLFLEEVNEDAYRVDRMLTHLRLSGSLARLSGMIVGHLGAFSGGGEPWPADWAGLLEDSLAGFDWPVALGLESGHFPPNRTLPLGLPARLEEEGRRLVLGAFEP
ncbi:MAG TPA: LD-carboxypeptidase [Thermoanaerobaculia bacterium]|nr:LD-carboxypeptidase [Thermoanaerobaculia bacterium]